MPAGSRDWGRVLLAVWFILTGLLALTNFEFAAAGIVLGLLAIIGGLLWLFGK